MSQTHTWLSEGISHTKNKSHPQSGMALEKSLTIFNYQQLLLPAAC
jgi:hypothetical protein